MSEIEDRWIAPGSKCDCCSRKRLENERPFCDEHMTLGGSGFNFNWCPECEKNRQKDCDKIILDCAVAWRKHCEECWAKSK
jgi:hypothetical protein